MISNYLKIALRTMLHNKAFTLINILGLSVGVACCLLLALFTQHEISYDKHHARLDDLYRIVTHLRTDVGYEKLSTTSPPIAYALKTEIPEVENYVRVYDPPGVSFSIIRHGEDIFYEPNGFVVDSTLFDMFSYELKEGNPKEALVQANSIVLSENLAKKLFGDSPALNQTISMSQGGTVLLNTATGQIQEYKVTGVFRKRHNSHINANFFTSVTSGGWGEYVRTEGEKHWAGHNAIPSYLRLVQGHNKREVEKKMNDVLMKHGADDLKALGLHKTLSLEPVKDIYLKSDVGQSPRLTYLYVVVSIAIFILLIACVNFMNLSTAKAIKRATEIGIRKTMGANRSSLIGQILGEAMVIVIFSIAISILIAYLLSPYFNMVTGRDISLNQENIPYFIIALIGITVVTGLVAGSYPAFYLSSYQPAVVLKGKIKTGNSTKVRQALVVFQFIVAIVLMCGVFVISNQLNFIRQKNLGFDYETKIVVPLRTFEAHNQYEVLKKEIRNSGKVNAISGTSCVPGSTIWNDLLLFPDGGNMETSIAIERNFVDAGYLEMMGIKLIAGRAFTDNREMEKRTKFILNRKTVSKLGFTPESILGQKLHMDRNGKREDYDVIGVMEDFHQNSLHEEIKPTLFEVAEDLNRYNYIVASISAADFEQSIRSIESSWKNLVTDSPFEYSFLSQNIQKQYKEDEKMAKVITSFGLIAIAICCLGLFGLSSYTAERRFKEIGIRKVMGASVGQIVTLMSTEFMKLVTLAFIVATPVAWIVMNEWLSTYAYRVSVSWVVFVLAGLIALSIAMITISFESIRAATTNPVKSLKNE